MVSPTCCAPGSSEATGGRRYSSRHCSPYSFTAYSDRRFHLSSSASASSHDSSRGGTIIMMDREEPDQPRKRIAVACGRCRKRKIRCSGDPGNGGPCSNCKNAAHEPCLFLRVSSQETTLKDTNDYSYNLDAARTYAHQSRGTISLLSPMAQQYTHEMVAGDGSGLATASYRHNSYAPYSSGKGGGYYPTMPNWTAATAYQDDGSNSVDYSSLGYSSYQLINQDPASNHLVSGYHPYAARKSTTVYMDPEAAASSAYPYGNTLMQRSSVVSPDSQGFSLSSIAASLPSASDRLHSSVNRTLTSPSASAATSSIYQHHHNHNRSEGIYGGKTLSSTSSSGSSNSNHNGNISDVAVYTSTMQQPFETPAYSTTVTTTTNDNVLTSSIAHRATAHADATYPTATVADQLYVATSSSTDPSMRSGDDGSYIYGDSSGGKLGGSGSSRRDSSHSSSGGGGGNIGSGSSLLSNGHVYIPESHHSVSTHSAPHTYVIPGTASSVSLSSGSQNRCGIDGSSVAVGVGTVLRSSGSSSSHRQSDGSHCRSAGNIRGAG